MIRIKYPILALVLLFIIACESELPPIPPSPGGDVYTGQAYAGMATLPKWAAEPKNIEAPSRVYFGDKIEITVSNFDYVYSKGYLFNSYTRAWEGFALKGTPINDWLKEKAFASILTDKNKFNKGNNYLIIYACSKKGKEWDCNNRKWMLKTIEILGPCKDECVKGQKQCYGNDYQECDNYDADTCLEWSAPIKCSENSYCQKGACLRKETEVKETIQKAEEPQQKETTPSPTICKSNSDCDDNNAATVDRCFPESGFCVHEPYLLCQTDADCSYKKVGFFARCYNLGEISACLGCSTDADCKFGYCNKDIPNKRKCVSKLKGPINVGVIEFKLSDTKFNNLFYCEEGNFRVLRSPACLENGKVIEKHDFLDLFNNIDGEKIFETVAGKQRALSVYYIPTYLKNQAKTYGITDLAINMEVKGPFDITKTFPESNLTTPIGRPISPYLFEFFEEQINERKVDVSKYDLIFVVFFDDYDISGRKQSVLFTDTAHYPYLFIDARTSTPPGISDQTIQTMIHEFLHLFEAKDKYIEPCPRGNYWSCCKDPEGLAEPNKMPKYPQTKACIMCGGITLKEDGESRWPQNIFEVEICDKTAQEIGWK